MVVKIKEKRVYVIDINQTNFQFREAEQIDDKEAIKAEAERLGTVYSLDYFQDEINSENLLLDNSFILID